MRKQALAVFICSLMFIVTSCSTAKKKEQIPFFESGIQKVRITTIPLIHEKTFTNDVIGHWLYKKLGEALKANDDF